MWILVSDPDARWSDPLARRLRREGFNVDVASSFAGLSDARAARAYDALILDTNLQGFAQEAFFAAEPPNGRRPGIVLTSRRRAVAARVRALDAGADDFVIKPYHVRELCARVRAVLRRQVGANGRRLVVDDLVLDPLTRQVWRGGRRLRLSTREFTLLEYLMRHRGCSVSRATLAKQLWGAQNGLSTNVIDVFVSRLRKKLDEGRRCSLLAPVRGVGYVIGAPE